MAESLEQRVEALEQALHGLTRIRRRARLAASPAADPQSLAAAGTARATTPTDLVDLRRHRHRSAGPGRPGSGAYPPNRSATRTGSRPRACSTRFPIRSGCGCCSWCSTAPPPPPSWPRTSRSAPPVSCTITCAPWSPPAGLPRPAGGGGAFRRHGSSPSWSSSRGHHPMGTSDGTMTYRSTSGSDRPGRPRAAPAPNAAGHRGDGLFVGSSSAPCSASPWVRRPRRLATPSTGDPTLAADVRAALISDHGYHTLSVGRVRAGQVTFAGLG